MAVLSRGVTKAMANPSSVTATVGQIMLAIFLRTLSKLMLYCVTRHVVATPAQRAELWADETAFGRDQPIPATDLSLQGVAPCRSRRWTQMMLPLKVFETSPPA
jgi:hypothetical protein